MNETQWRRGNEIWREKTLDIPDGLREKITTVLIDGILFGLSISWPVNEPYRSRPALESKFQATLQAYREGKRIPYALADGRQTWCQRPGIIGIPT